MRIQRGARRAAVFTCVPATLVLAGTAGATDPLEEIVIIASRMHAPLLVVTDPAIPRQPLPAQDGADYLKTIPGFSVIRKGGTGGDPVFRGMAASRVNMLLDGEQLLGGCGMRMDPPTAYIFPDAYDRIVVVKGPQTTLQGPGNSAAAVSFERDIERFEQNGYRLRASAIGASFGRNDLVGDLRAGTPVVYGQLTATHATSDDFEDGSGQRVHSAYSRWSANGAELQQNQHSLRSTMNQPMMPYQSLPRLEDAWFRSIGLFGEMNRPVGSRSRLVAGLRGDFWRAEDERETLRVGMLPVPNPTAGDSRDRLLPSGFARLERDLAEAPATGYVGLGHVQRFPDYWELVSAGRESVDSLSAFGTRPERTTQLDTGVVYSGARLSASVSAFVSDVDDYILIQSRYPKGPRLVTVTRNVDARTWGGEADASFALAPGWTLTSTLAYTHGENRSDDRPLAQMPPLELRNGLSYEQPRWSAGVLWRLVAEQDRYAIDQGNIVGQDLGRTGGFGVLSFNAGWLPANGVQVTAGVDNLFDKLYAEHLSRGGAMVSGFEQTAQVNEPGRTIWLKVGARLD